MKVLSLTKEEISSDKAEDVDDVLSLLSLNYNYDVLVIDDSYSGNIRAFKRTSSIPIFVCMGHFTPTGRENLLNLGADYCLEKPLHLGEYQAALNAQVRAVNGNSRRSVFSGELKIDLVSQDVSYAGKPIHLTEREYQVLECLALSVGKTATKGHIYESMYPERTDVEVKIVDVFICKLRSCIARYSDKKHIVTVWGRGWKLLREPEKVAE